MNASVRAWQLMGEEYYTCLLDSVFCRHGVVVQTAAFFLAFVVEDGCAVVWFACGDMREILRFAHVNAEFFGVKRVSWSREWAGKHKAMNTYTMEQLRR